MKETRLTVISRSALIRMLLPCVLATNPVLVTAAQTQPAPGGERLSAVLAVPVPGVALAAATGLILTGELPGIAVSLESPPGMRPVVFQKIIDDLNNLPIILFAEKDFRLTTPEFEGCVLQGPVGVQQCTVGFVSGNPGLGCQQSSWLPVTQLGTIAGFKTLYEPVIGVIDSGIDPTVPALNQRLFSLGKDFISNPASSAGPAIDVKNGLDDDKDGLIDEAYGHGTHVATTILTAAPDALIQPYRVVDADGVGWGFDVAEAILQATTDGVDVINISLAMSQPTQLVSLALGLALANRIDIFASAGNTGANLVLYPSTFSSVPNNLFPLPADMPRRVISVAAVDGDLKVLPFSAYGSEVDISCLGYRVCALVPGGATNSWSGTSMATAVATGSAALVRSKLPPTFDAPLGELVCDTADSVEAQNPGFVGQLGTGFVNPVKALQKGRALSP
jgi:Subtilase family